MLSWTAPTGKVSGYRVYYGTASRAYAQARGAGSYTTTNSYTTPNLVTGTTYYFSVTAIDAAGQESAYSSEISKHMP